MYSFGAHASNYPGRAAGAADHVWTLEEIAMLTEKTTFDENQPKLANSN